MISFDEAYNLTLGNIQPLPGEDVPLLLAEGRITDQDLLARVDVPSLDVSLKDGYAILAVDISTASVATPVTLKLAGSVAAGGQWQGTLNPGEAIRILSGAPLPGGADTVVAEEFTRSMPGFVQVVEFTEAGRNILRRGTDIHAGQLVVPAGQRLNPTVIGYLAAAGFQEIPVTRQPRVAILATGDEVLAPEQPLVQGKLYASNLFTLAAWCRHFGYPVKTYVLQDDAELIRRVLADCLEQFDAVLTSGGAWKGEHDLVVKILDDLGWRKIYHRIRMGPGKAVGFGLFNNKPVFCLPGGPPSNHMAFLQLALPGLQKLAGDPQPGFTQVPAVLAERVTGQVDWTQFIHGRLEKENQHFVFHPLRMKSRLQEMAQTEAVARIPEGLDELKANSPIVVQVLITP